MANQCVHCGKIYPDATRELLEGCGCGSKFFYYIKQLPKEDTEGITKIKETQKELTQIDKKQMEKDVREMIGAEDEEVPVILDLESIRITEPGKYEIDVVNLFDKKRPLIYRLEEGKYVIDLTRTHKVGMKEISEKIKKPTKKRGINEKKQYGKDKEDN